MRITTKMMMNTTMTNINNTKITVDAMNKQLTTQKKIQSPHEDPVIAIRALRFRSTLSELNQYNDNNIPDAESWLEVTEQAVSDMQDILKSMYEQMVYAANDTNTTEERQAILDELTQYMTQFYYEGNTDYAGRTIFTGYRTNCNLTFTGDTADTSYEITQDFTYQDMEERTYYSGGVTSDALSDLAQAKNELDADSSYYDTTVSTYNRIRLAYSSYQDQYMSIGSLSITTADGTTTYEEGDGLTTYDTLDEWQAAGCAVDDGGIVFIAETGELILGSNVSADFQSAGETGGATLSVTYDKTGFSNGEVRPEYYYNCTDTTDSSNPVSYVRYDEDGSLISQSINYAVASNQTLTVNIEAVDFFDSSLYRDIEELTSALTWTQNLEDQVSQIENMMSMQEYADDESQATLQSLLDEANKQLSYAQDNLQSMFNSYVDKMSDYREQVDLADTKIGAKGVNLDLVSNRVGTSIATVEDLKDQNEDRDLSDIIIDFTASYTAYQAALQAATYLNQTSLLNYL